MIKSLRLMTVMMVICLLLPLTGWAAAAAVDELPPEQVGSWVGYYMGYWGNWTFTPDGHCEVLVYDNNVYSGSGHYSQLMRETPDAVSAFEGDQWKLTYGYQTNTFRRMKAPYVRVKAEDETASAPAVQELIGTFGGKLDGVYVEWTFHGDGRFTQITPYEELEENGFFMAGEGDFAILLGGKLVTYPYRTRLNFIILYPSQTGRIAFARRFGPLEQKLDK